MSVRNLDMFLMSVFRFLPGICLLGLSIPDGIAVLAGLAVQETQLLEGLAENVFAGHVVLRILGCV